MKSVQEIRYEWRGVQKKKTTNQTRAYLGLYAMWGSQVYACKKQEKRRE